MREDITQFAHDDDDGRPLHVEMLGTSYCDGTYRIARSGSAVNVFEYVVKGKGVLEIETARYEPAAGGVYIVPERSAHRYWSSADDPWTKIWFNVRGPLAIRLLDLYGLSSGIYVPDCPSVEETFRTAQERAKADPLAAHDIVTVAIHEIIIQVALTLRQRAMGGRPKETIALKNYLDQNVSRNVALDKMCHLAGKSPSQTIRTFKREWGMTPYQYLLRRKIEVAELLLTGTVKPVKEIASDLGFSDEFYFSNIFKKKTGVSPSAARNETGIKNAKRQNHFLNS